MSSFDSEYAKCTLYVHMYMAFFDVWEFRISPRSFKMDGTNALLNKCLCAWLGD